MKADPVEFGGKPGPTNTTVVTWCTQMDLGLKLFQRFLSEKPLQRLMDQPALCHLAKAPVLIRIGPEPCHALGAVRRQQGFTVVELLVIAAMVFLLGTMLITGLARTKPASKSTECLKSLRQLTLAWRHYSGDNRDVQACGFSFADGHAEIHRWTGLKVGRAPITSTGNIILNVPAGDSWVDMHWLAENTTVRN